MKRRRRTAGRITPEAERIGERLQRIDFDGVKRTLDAAIARRNLQIANLAGMPAIDVRQASARQSAIDAATGHNNPIGHVEGMTEKFAKETHPIKTAFGIKTKAKEKSWRKRWASLNPFSFSNPLYHPLKTAGKLMPVRIKSLGIGRDRRGKQIGKYETDVAKKAADFSAAGGEQLLIGALGNYKAAVGNAFAELQQTGNQLVFDRKVNDAEKLFDARVSGEKGFMGRYGKERKS